jgi:putative ABC transport system substrate-binding protein
LIDLLVNPEGAITAASTGELETAARQLGRELRIHRASNDAEIDAAFATMAQLKAGALQVMADSFFGGRNRWLARLTAQYAIPAITVGREFTLAGGLMNYGAVDGDSFRLVGSYTVRILKGEKPAELPVQQVTKLEMIINLKAAKALGVTVPLPLLARADEVIE